MMKAESSSRTTKLLKCQPCSSWGSWDTGALRASPGRVPWDSHCSVRSLSPSLQWNEEMFLHWPRCSPREHSTGGEQSSLCPQQWGGPAHLLCHGLVTLSLGLRGTSSSASSLKFWITGNSDLERCCGGYFFFSPPSSWCYLWSVEKILFLAVPLPRCWQVFMSTGFKKWQQGVWAIQHRLNVPVFHIPLSLVIALE